MSLVSEIPKYAKLYEITHNVGIIADRALADGAGNNIAETYLPYLPKNYVIESEDDVEAAFNDIKNNQKQYTVMFYQLSMKVMVPVLGGGRWLLEVFLNRDYGIATAKRYSDNNTVAPKIYYRSLNMGAWGNWYKSEMSEISFTAALELETEA